MTGLSRIECLFDDLINFYRWGDGDRFYFENKVLSLFTALNRWRPRLAPLTCLLTIQHPTNIDIPHNVQLVVFFSITTKNRETTRMTNICCSMATEFTYDVCEFICLTLITLHEKFLRQKWSYASLPTGSKSQKLEQKKPQKHLIWCHLISAC